MRSPVRSEFFSAFFAGEGVIWSTKWRWSFFGFLLVGPFKKRILYLKGVDDKTCWNASEFSGFVHKKYLFMYINICVSSVGVCVCVTLCQVTFLSYPSSFLLVSLAAKQHSCMISLRVTGTWRGGSAMKLECPVDVGGTTFSCKQSLSYGYLRWQATNRHHQPTTGSESAYYVYIYIYRHILYVCVNAYKYMCIYIYVCVFYTCETVSSSNLLVQ